MPHATRRLKPRAHAAALGILAVALAWFSQFLTVRYNYGGNWTALFCIAPHMPVPDFLRSEHLYIFEGSEGYDGQVYHLIAHDPWVRRGSADAIVGPAIFYQRIFVPALAWLLSLGRDPWIHCGYDAVILAFVFLGVYWLSQVASRAGVNAAWGLAFLLTPAAITSVDRMTVDIVVAAFAAGFALYAIDGPSWKIFAVLACAALTKEQALPIVAAYSLYLLTQKRVAAALWMLAAALPTLAWFVYLARARPAPSVAAALSWVPMAGLFDALLHPASYHMTAFRNAVALTFDYVALAGLAIALGQVVWIAIARRSNPSAFAVYALAVAALFPRNPVLWTSAYAFGRGLTPLFLLLAIDELSMRPWLAVLPMFLVDTRIGLNLVSQVAGVVHGLIGH
jgi:hypothetical protein